MLGLALCVIGLAQERVGGRVYSEEGAIPGATIRILDTEFGTTSDANGDFLFAEYPEFPFKIEVRSVGFKLLTQTIYDLKPIEIQLDESVLSMDEVVVTGTMQPTFVSASPVKIDVITSEYLSTFQPAAATSIVEGISLVNGVQEVVACGVCFTNSISINGLPGPYTAVLMDGTPIYGNLASVYGLNGIPSMIIDRFEVIKGPSSTLYGSEAVAGVINIITKNPETQPALTIDVMGTTHMESFGNFSIAPRVGKSSGFVGVNYAYINDFDDQNGDGFGDNINLDRISLFTKWNINRKSDRTFSIAGKYYYEDRRNGVEDFLTDRGYRQLRGSESIYGESIYTHRFEVFGSYELPSNFKLDFSGSTHRQDSYYGADQYVASQDILFTNLIWANTLKDHNVTAGLTNRLQTYDDNTVATENHGVTVRDSQYIPGVFLQDEWMISEKFTLLSGARLDHYRNHGPILAPRLSTKFKPGDWTTIRTNFGTGFRIVNLFTEDHAFVTGQREVVLEEELKPEESYNLSTNFNHVFTWGGSQGMLDIDAYYTHFTNKITPDYDSSPNQIVYENSRGHAVSRGIGMTIQQEFSIPLALNVGVNFQDVYEFEDGVKRDIEFANDWSGILTLNYRVKKADLSISYTARVTGPMSLPTVFDLDESGNPESASRPTSSEPFAIHNLQLNKSFANGFSVYAGLQNLFNYIQPWSPLIGFNDPNSNPGFSDSFDTAYAYSPIHGREFYLGINWQLSRSKE